VLDPNYHVFLEDLSGDFFCYDKHTCEWKPKGNFGLHYSRISASQQGAVVKGPTDMLKKVKTYEPPEDNTTPVLVITGCNETVIQIKPNMRQHWIVKNLNKRFLAECKNSWDPHPFNIRQQDINVV
jgi:hypothetical protein